MHMANINFQPMNLSIKNLSKKYPNGVKAIDDLTLTINIGMFGLLGPNGAGKSSLMRTIATLQDPDNGSIHFNEIDVLANKTELRKQLGYLPQDFGVYPKQSARNLLDYFAILKGIASKKAREMVIDEVLELTNLIEFQYKYVSEFSGGMKQRFGIAQLLLNRPKLIIVDEPTAGLDPAERKRFLNVLRDVGSQNVVLFSTHIVDDVTDLCTDMAIINQGRVVHKNTPKRAIIDVGPRIWSRQIQPDELSDYEENHSVISSHFTDENLLSIRVFSENQPNQTFKTTPANLEDVYFSALKGLL